MNEMVDPPRYAYLEQGDKDGLCPIMIMEGPFEGFVYQYGVVKVDEIAEDESARLSFDYQLIEVPGDYVVPENEDEEKEVFEHVIGDILTSIIISTAEEKDDREADSGESDI